MLSEKLSVRVNEKRKLAMCAAGLASALSVLMFSTLLARYASVLLLLAVALPLAACLSPASRAKPSLWHAGLLAAICLPALGPQVSLGQIAAALLRFYPVMLLLIGIAHFRHSIMRSGLAAMISRRLVTPGAAKGQGLRNSARVAVLTALLSIFSGQGSIAIVCTALFQNVRNRLAIPPITNRAMVSTMFMLPTTIASASVASAIPHLDSASVALFGIPLTVWSLCGAMAPRLEVLPVQTGGAQHGGRQPQLLAGVFLLVCGGCYWLTRQMTLSFAAAMAAGYLLEALAFAKAAEQLGRVPVPAGGPDQMERQARNRHAAPGRHGQRARALLRESATSLDAIVPELCLLAVSGLLIFTVARVDLLAHLPAALAPFFANIYGVLFVLVLLLPLITVAGVHPLILFGVFFSLMQPPAFEHNHLRYLAWTSMFVMANLMSPVSISSIVSATAIGSTPRATSYAANWKFCLGLMGFTFVYLVWLVR
ncbi:hypothetical protein HSX11_05600 [Oxalobacteraceae bacterium]|nr:hypothetical protein [Oxalobacteraceae bacterium]